MECVCVCVCALVYLSAKCDPLHINRHWIAWIPHISLSLSLPFSLSVWRGIGFGFHGLYNTHTHTLSLFRYLKTKNSLLTRPCLGRVTDAWFKRESSREVHTNPKTGDSGQYLTRVNRGRQFYLFPNYLVTLVTDDYGLGFGATLQFLFLFFLFTL